MKNAYCLIILVFSVFASFAQIKAVTKTGDKVTLFADGTWEYEDKVLVDWDEISVNSKKFKKKTNSDFLVESTKIDIGIWLDPKKWTFEKSGSNEASEYSFTLRDEDLYAMLISEKMEIPIETLKEIVLENAKAAAPNAKISKQEYRNVNGTEILMLQMNGSARGIDFVYFGYYFSNENGTVQLLTYTAKNMFDTYYEEMEDFLNGFVLVKS